MHKLVSTGCHNELRDLLKEGFVDVNYKTKDGYTALHLAVLIQDTIAIEILKQFGANVSISNNQRITPLEMAKSKGFKQDVITALSQLCKKIYLKIYL